MMMMSKGFASTRPVVLRNASSRPLQMYRPRMSFAEIGVLNGLTCHGKTLRAHEETTHATIKIYFLRTAFLRCD
jgi:hypothetical protein